MLFKALSVKHSMVKFQLKVYKVVGAVGITYMLDRLLASVFFSLEMIIWLPQRCQNLPLDLELLRRCSGATEQSSFPGFHFLA